MKDKTPTLLTLALALLASPALATPQFGTITPPDGTVLAATEVRLEGTVEGATSLEIEGDPVPLLGNSFDVTVELQEGTTSYLLIAYDNQGGETQLIHQIIGDTEAPHLSISQPAPGAMLANTAVTVSGTVTDPQLSEVLVEGEVAVVEGASFRREVILGPGPQSLVVIARDILGHEAQDVVTVTHDPDPPVIMVTEGGSSLVDGAVFNRAVSPVVAVTDVFGVASTEILLDGFPFSSGSSVADEGAHTLVVVATDVAGNVAQRTLDFVLDFMPPTIVSVTPPDRTVTAEAAVTLVVEVEEATSVTVGGQAANLVDGMFRFGPYGLTDGEEVELTILATDAAGNQSSRQHRIERDSKAPMIIDLQPADGTELAATSVGVSGTADDFHLAEVRVANELASLDGINFSVPAVDLSEGVNAVAIVAVDAVGNTSQQELTILRDTMAPEIQVEAGGAPLVDGAAFAGAVTLTIQVTDTTAVDILATLSGQGVTFPLTVDADGEYQLSVTATDALDHSTDLDLEFVIDTEAPEIVSVSPPEGDLTADSGVTISGEVYAADAVTVNGYPATLNGTVFNIGPLSLPDEGENPFIVIASDRSGNSAQMVRRVVLDSSPPELSIGQPPADAVVKTTSVGVSGSVSDRHLVSVSVNAVEATVTGGSFIAFLVPLVEDDNEIRVVAEDAVGLTTTRTRNVVLDTEDPEIAITDPAPGTVVPDEEIVLRGTADDPHLDRVEVGGRPAQLDGGDWSITVALEPGPNDFTALAFDTLGHVSPPQTLMVFRDNEAPSVQINDPPEGLITAAASVEVNGDVEVESGVILSVNGVEVVADADGNFTTTVELAEEGENRIIARATDAEGNQGTHTRMVTRDTAPPAWLSSDPADSALAVPVNAAFRLGFSETLSEPAAGTWSLETAAGAGIAAVAAVDGDEMVVTPSSPLPSQTDLRLVLTAGLVDLAGNPLTDPPTLNFTTADAGAPGAPVLDPIPALHQCVAAAQLSGTTEPRAVVRVTGGAATVSVRADDEGAFALAVPLVPDLLNHLEIVAVDLNGNPSPAAYADVVQDCEAPRVASAERAGDVLTITFTETVDDATVAPAVTVRDASGAVSGSITAVGDTATFTADSPLPTEGVRLEVDVTVTDLAGNPLAYPFSRLFGEALDESFFSGTVIDQSTGRPLAGTRVEVTASGGVALPEPRPVQVTGDDGRFLIAVAAGDHEVVFSRPGYIPALRQVITAAGQGTDVFDPRLTPENLVATVSASGGTVGGQPGLELVVPAGALTVSGEVRLTSIDGQGLPAKLPYGWSPRGAVWVALPEALQAPADLRFPVESPDGTVLTLVELDLATLEWRAVAAVTVVGGAVDTQITALGAYVAVEPDAGALAPPPAVAGEVLGGSPPPVGDEITAVTLTFDPEVVLPAQRSRATVVFELAAEIPSGVPVTLSVREELELLDGSLRRETPYRADVVIYRALDGVTPLIRFWLRPSLEARRQPVRLGAEEVDVLTYGGQSVSGNVLGSDGGSVANDEGDRIEVPAGALGGSAAVVLYRRQVTDLPLPEPAGVMIEAVVEVDLGGVELALPAELSAALAPPPAAGETGILLHLTEVAGLAVYRPVAEIVPTAGGWLTAAIDSADLAWPGVVRGGFYAFARFTSPHGFLRGVVFDVGGAPLAGAMVISPDVDWIQLANADGSYVLPLPVGSATPVDVLHPQNGNAESFTADITAGGERVDHDPTLQVVAPSVVETTPSDGEDEQLIGIQPTVRFSEPVDRQSLDDGIELWLDGQPVATDFIHQSDLVTVIPETSLLPGRTYELRVTTNVRDLDGYLLASPVIVYFTTQAVVLPDELDPSRIVLYEPDADGEARVVGLPGSTPAEHTVWVENLTGYANSGEPLETPTITTGQDGSFELTIASSVEDLLLLHLLIDGGNEVQLPLGPFVSVDGRSVWAGPAALFFTTADGVTVQVEEGTFEGMARVTFEPRAVDEPPIAVPELLDTVAAFELDFGGATAKKPLLLRLPATAETPEGVYLLNRLVDVPGGQAWMTHDLMWRNGDHLTTEDADLQQPQSTTDSGGEKVDSGTSIRQLSPAGGDKSHVRPPALYKKYLPGAAVPGTYHVENPLEEVRYFVLPLQGSNVLFNAFARSWDGIVAVVNQSIEQLLAFDGILMPSIIGRPLEIEVRELTTHYLMFEGTFDPPASGELIVLEPDNWTDTTAPVPIGGSPIRFFQLLFGERAARGDLDAGISYQFDPDSELLTVIGEPGSAHAEVQVRWLNVDFDRDQEESEEPLPEDQKTKATYAASDGSFVLTATARPERRYVIAIGAEIAGDQPLEIRFSEGVMTESASGDASPVIPGIRVALKQESDDQPVSIETDLVETSARVLVSPFAGWRAGKEYVLYLEEELADVRGNAWGQVLAIEFEIERGETLDTVDLETVRDSVRLGSLLFVAADRQGLMVFDVSDPKRMTPYVYREVVGENGPVREPLGLPFPFGDAVRGVAVDPHGRVLVAGGGTSSFGQLKILDPLALDPAAIAQNPDDVEVLSAAFKGSSVISDQLGAAGTQLPAGTPLRVAVLSNDETYRWTAGKEPPEGSDLKISPEELPPFALTVSGRAAAESEVTFRKTNSEPATEQTMADELGVFAVTLDEIRIGDHLELERSHGVVRWRAGQTPGGALSLSSVREAEPFLLTVSGCAEPGRPVTLRDTHRGRWHRSDANPPGEPEDPPCHRDDPLSQGYFSVELEVYPGDELELVENLDSIAYVATLGAGIEVVDVNSFYNEEEIPSPIQSNVLAIYSGVNDPELVLCGQPAGDLSGAVIDLGALLDLNGSHPFTVAALAAFSGLVLLDSNVNSPGQISFIAQACAQDYGNDNVAGLEVLQEYPFDFDDDGEYSVFEYRDLAILAHRSAGILIYDITQRQHIDFLGRIPLPGPVAELRADRTRRLLYASAHGEGIYVLDLDAPPFDGFIDEDDDDVDDRLLETISLGGNNNAPLLLVPELGLGYAGGFQRGLSSVVLGGPRLTAAAPAADGGQRALTQLAPLGVPTGPESSSDNALQESSFYLLGSLPGFVGDQVKLELVSVGPGGFEIDAPGNPEDLPGLPVTGFREEDGNALVLERLAPYPWQEGYQVFRSSEIVAYADLRAVKAYDRTPLESAVCNRCEGSEHLLESSLELLSGHTLAVRFAETTRQKLEPIYGAARLDQAELEIESVPWDLSPAVRQEPALNPSHGTGDVAPGTLLHSGEMSMEATDVVLRGRGFDFAFTRTYRSGIVGGGPLGPGCDHNYRQRLRPLPDGDVEYFDGRGRRELFDRQDSGEYLAVGRFVDLARTAAGWVLVDARRNVYRFDQHGRLTSIADAVKESESTGNEMLFRYDGRSRLETVIDTLGRPIDFAYDDAGRLTEIRDFSGREFHYIYDDDGRLQAARTPAVTTVESPITAQRLETSYAYETIEGDLAERLNRRNNCLSTTDAKDQKWLELIWDDGDGDGRHEEVASQLWGGVPVSIEYLFSTWETHVMDRREKLWQYKFNVAGQTTRIEDPTEAVWTFQYDGDGLMTRKTMPLGRLTDYLYPDDSDRRSQGNLSQVTITPDSRGTNGSSETLVTRFEYEPVTNQPTRIIDPRGAVTEIDREPNSGLAVQVTRAKGAPEQSSTAIDYNSFGQPERLTNANQHQTRFEYFNQGEGEGYLRKVVVDPGGLELETSFKTDARGNVVERTDPRGVRHRTEYNDLDWVVEERRAVTGSSDDSTSGGGDEPPGAAPPLGYTTRRLYDAAGNLAELEIPLADGSQSTLERFAYGSLDEPLEIRRQISPGQPEAEWIVEMRDYDANRNLIRVVDPEGHVVETDYDARNLPSATRSLLESGSIDEAYSFTPDRELDVRLDGRGNPWRRHYDGYGRLRELVDPLANKRRLEYDDNGNLRTERSFDGPERLLAESAFDYDLLNRRLESREMLWDDDSESAQPLRTKVAYDPMSNPTRVEDPLGRLTTYEYDAAERLVEVEDPSGNRRELDLDKVGNVRKTTTFEKDSEGQVFEVIYRLTYDALNRPSKSLSSICELVAGEGEPSELEEQCNTVKTFYDARDQLVRIVDEEGWPTVYAYDGLDRLTREERPEGIRVDYTYDRNSRLTQLEDVRGNVTEYRYDAAHRRTSVTYPDRTTESYTYDENHNLIGRVDSRGLRISQTFDTADLLVNRTIEPAPGGQLVGPTAELYQYDGLYRLTEARSVEPSIPDVVTRLAYDSLSRVVSEETLDRRVAYTRDYADNVTRIGYPSGVAIGREVDDLDRLFRSGVMAVLEEGRPPEIDPQRAAKYTYRGPWLVHSLARGNGLMTRTEAWDAARRPLQVASQSPEQLPVVSERLRWSPRGLKTAISRDDANGTGWLLQQDGALRTKRAGGHPHPAALVQDNEVVSAEAFSESESGFRYSYDPAQNLESMMSEVRGEKQTTVLAQDNPNDAQRNRPSKIGDVTLGWDASGNLIEKGALRFSYDYRNRLTEVSDSGIPVARYKYDVFNRRVGKELLSLGSTEQVAWSGWQEIEHYRDGALTSRSVFGSGLDEIVHSAWDLDSDGQVETDLYPIYDHIGNVTAMTNTSGRIVARYEYSPFGEEIVVQVDELPPAIQQIRVEPPNLIRIEGDEVLWLGALEAGIENGGVTVTIPDLPNGQQDASDAAGKTSARKALSLSVAQPILRGREARRRAELTIADPPAPGTEVQLTLTRSAVRDHFHNSLSEDLQLVFTWPDVDEEILADTTPPAITEIFVRAGHVEVTLSETPDMARVPAAFQIDGGSVSWTLLEDTYTMRTQHPLAPGIHILRVDPSTPFDLAGLGVTELFEQEFTVEDGNSNVADPRKESGEQGDTRVFSLPDPRVVPLTALANRVTFHGRPLDVESGFLYFRNRYYDPDMGRFITTDPMEYVDGPSMYQFAGYNAFDHGDPLGKCVGKLQQTPFCQSIASLFADMLVGEEESSRVSEIEELTARFVREQGRHPRVGEVVAWDWATSRYLADGEWWKMTSRGVKPRMSRGAIEDKAVIKRRIVALEQGNMANHDAIVLHRTVTANVRSTLRSFQRGVGTHFIVDRRGNIHQTASLDQFTHHVGNIRARCREEGTCTPAELQAINAMGWAPRGISRREIRNKTYPTRYPINNQSIGIEVVATYDTTNRRWQMSTPDQLESVRALVVLLQSIYGLDDSDVLRHDVISYKTAGEGAGLGFP